MKIKTRLYLNSIIVIFLVSILFSAVFLISNKVTSECKKMELAQNVHKAVLELDIVTYEYLLYHEKRMEQQWHLQYDSIAGLLAEAEKLAGKETEELVAPLRTDYAALGDLFSQVNVNYENQQELIQGGAAQEKIDSVMGLGKRLTAQLLIRSHSMIIDASKLSKEAYARAMEAQKLARSLTLILVSILIVTTMTTMFLIAKTISKSLNKLIKGTEITGKGNLEYRIDIKNMDEFGDLALAFNQMIENLAMINIKLKGRMKELRVIYDVSKIMEVNPDLNKALNKVVKTIPSAYRFPELACARIVYNGKEYKTDNFKKTYWSQSAVIYFRAKPAGVVEVCYLKEKSFFAEEEEMIREVAAQMGNIIERKKAEQALQESEERYRSLIEGSHDIIQSVSPDGHFRFVNKAWHDILGYTKKELPKLTLFDIIHPDSFEHCKRAFQRIMAGKSLKNVEAKFVAKDGHVIFVEGNAFPRYEGNKIIATQGFFRDVTERERAEEQTRELQEYLQLQINRMPIGLIVWDTDFRVKTWNPSATRIFGFSEKEALGRHPYDLIVPKEVQPHVDKIWRRLIEGDQTAHSINENITKGGRTIICEWSNTPLKKADGTVIGVLSMVQDITERKKAEKEAKEKAVIEQQLKQQKEIDKMKTEFIYIVSHQLRTPLSVIRGNLEMIIDEITGKISKEQSETLEQAHLGAKRMIKLVNDLLNLSRLETGKLKIQIQLVQLESLISEIIKENERLIKDQKCKVRLEKPKIKLSRVSADPALLRQVVNNLLVNAIHYSKKDRCNVCIAIKKRAKDYLISVADKGVGIPKDAQSKIFTKFFRTDYAQRMKPEGSGLGLYIMKMIIETWGGEIWFESEESKGTTFYFTLPLKGMNDQGGKKSLVDMDEVI